MCPVREGVRRGARAQEGSRRGGGEGIDAGTRERREASPVDPVAKSPHVLRRLTTGPAPVRASSSPPPPPPRPGSSPVTTRSLAAMRSVVPPSTTRVSSAPEGPPRSAAASAVTVARDSFVDMLCVVLLGYVWRGWLARVRVRGGDHMRRVGPGNLCDRDILVGGRAGCADVCASKRADRSKGITAEKKKSQTSEEKRVCRGGDEVGRGGKNK